MPKIINDGAGVPLPEFFSVEEPVSSPVVVPIVGDVVVEDKYPAQTHMDNSIPMYDAPYHEIAGAIGYGQAKYPDKYKEGFSRVDVKQLLTEFLAQEHQGEKKILEGRV